MADTKLLDELFSVASTANRYGSALRHLPAGEALPVINIPVRVKHSTDEIAEQNLNQQKLHYSYGL